MAWTKQLLGYRTADIQHDDTLHKIALREMGNASYWTQLAAVNNLQPPYIVNSLSGVTSAGVLIAGGTIKIPAPVTTQSGVSDESSLLGTDLLLVDGMLTADGAGDIQTVSGIANLAQALDHRVRTRPGELMYHPKYGCRVYSLLGRGNNPVAMQLAAAWTAKCIRSDPRVSDAKATAAASGDTIAVSGTAVPVVGKPLPVGATLST